MVLNCPDLLSDIHAVNYVNEAWGKCNELDLVLNFSSLKFVYPAGALILALGIRDLVLYRSDKSLHLSVAGVSEIINTSPVDYLCYFGFFRFIGVDIGNQVDDGSGGRRSYIPITTLKRYDFHGIGRPWQERIMEKSKDLAMIIYPHDDDQFVVDMLEYCFTEIIRNVFEHADIDRCHIMAQKWSHGYAEIAIADEGVGIMRSLEQAHKLTSPEMALDLAILPGISKDTEPENDDDWQNTGFGLYVMSELGKEIGAFSLLSSGRILRLAKNFQHTQPAKVDGTVVKLRVRTDESEYFPNLRKQIVDRGEMAAKQIPGAKRKASKGSRRLW